MSQRGGSSTELGSGDVRAGPSPAQISYVTFLECCHVHELVPHVGNEDMEHQRPPAASFKCSLAPVVRFHA